MDFALLDLNGARLGHPYHCRDRRTDGMMPEAFRRVPCEEIYEQTGTQFMQLNMLYQLLAMATGNILLQARAVGLVGSLTAIRRVVRASFPIITYEPHPSDRWDEQFERFRKLLDTSSLASEREES